MGDLAFAFAAGSLIEGFTDDADLDLTFVWTGPAPAVAERKPADLIDRDPSPEQFEQPNFNLDRFWINGQQFDVKHTSLAEFCGWVDDVVSGGGTTGYPMPAIVAHALTTGAIVFDEQGIADELCERLTPPSDSYVSATAQRWTSAQPSYLHELDRAVDRDDRLLFHHLAVEALRLAFIAWFASQGRYWPHEKRLSLRLRRLGFDHIAALEEQVWSAPGIAQRRTAVRNLASALFPSPGAP